MEADALFARIWADGLPQTERVEWASVPDARRAAVLQRLRALLSLEAGDVRIGEAADLAGLSRQAFHKLRSRWTQERSIRSVIPYRFKAADVPDGDGAGGGLPLDTKALSSDSATTLAIALIEEHPAESNGRLGRRLRGSLDHRISLPTAVEAVRRARHLVALDPGALAKAFGRSLLIDFVGVRVDGVSVDTDRVVVAALVLERASGLILGFRAGDRDDMARLQTEAVRDALETIGDQGIDVTGSEPANCRIVLPDPEYDFDRDERADRLRDLLGHDRVFADGVRRFGVRTTSVIGHKVGRVRFFSRIGEGETGRAFRAAPSEPGDPELTLDQFATLARSEIDRGNEALLARVWDLPDRMRLCRKGAMTTALRRALAVLTNRS